MQSLFVRFKNIQPERQSITCWGALQPGRSWRKRQFVSSELVELAPDSCTTCIQPDILLYPFHHLDHSLFHTRLDGRLSDFEADGVRRGDGRRPAQLCHWPGKERAIHVRIHWWAELKHVVHTCTILYTNINSMTRGADLSQRCQNKKISLFFHLKNLYSFLCLNVSLME